MSGEELTFSSRYKLDGKLGSGGMGAVYRAYDSVLKKNVAVKLLLPSLNQNMAVRFQQEAKAAAKLDHPNIIRVLDFGQTDKGECYLIMEYLQGQTLEKIIKSSGPLDLQSALKVFEQICLGMQHAHSHGVLHRDIKPSNIMIDGESKHVTIVDFGVAKFLSEDTHLTGRGKPLGSPAYMSPEQAQGNAVDVRSDLYSMGCVMYMTLVGKPPLVGSTSLETIKKQIEEEAPLLNDGRNTSKFSDELEALVEKALAKDPDDRFSNFEELHQSIAALTKSRPTAIDEHSTPSKTERRRVLRGGTLLVMTLAAITISVGYFMYLDRTEIFSTSKAEKKKTEQSNFKNHAGYLIYYPQWLMGTGELHQNGLSELVDHRNSDHLILDDPKISDTDLNSLAPLPLVALDLSGTHVTLPGLSLITLPALRCLILNDNPQITDDSIAQNIQVFRRLHVLALRNTSITDKGVIELSKIKSLRCLDLEQQKGVTSKSLDYLANLKNLQCLKISGTAIGAKDVDKLLTFPSLRYISFGQKNVTDETFDTLLKLNPLLIGASNSNITDKSLYKLLKIDYPVIIEVNGCEFVTKKAVAKVRAQFPPGDRLIDRIQNDFFDPTDGCGVPPGEGSLRCFKNSLWYEPRTYLSRPPDGYQEAFSYLDHVQNYVKESKNKKSTKQSQKMPFIDIEKIEEVIDEGLERRTHDVLAH